MSVWLNFKGELSIKRSANISLEKSLRDHFNFDCGEMIVDKFKNIEHGLNYDYTIKCRVLMDVVDFVVEVRKWKEGLGKNLVHSEIWITSGLI